MSFTGNQSLHGFFARITPNAEILCMDIGAYKTGLAYTDNMILAQPLSVIPTTQIYQYVGQYEHIVIGWPIENNGSMNEQCELIQQIYLSISGMVNAILWDERFTTKIVEKNLAMTRQKSRKKRKHKHIDDIAACFILESLLSAREYHG